MHSTAVVRAGILAVWAASACARAPTTGSFVATIGDKDTVAVESYTQYPGRVEGLSVTAYPKPAFRQYQILFDSAGDVSHVRIEARVHAGPQTIVELSYDRDSVTVVATQDSAEMRFSAATQGSRPLPMMTDLFILWELSLAAHAAEAADSTIIGVVTTGKVEPLVVRRIAGGALSFGYDGWGEGRAYLDPRGRLDSLDLTRTTTKYRVVRRRSADIDRIFAAWSEQPERGPLSPRDSAALAGDARIRIEYGRPSARGRTVFGGLVPWGEVWRLGANAATTFRLERDATVGGIDVPAGTYSLWAIPTPAQWTIVLNRQHGQWGTQYDPQMDFARFVAKPSLLDAPVESFTITIASNGATGGTIVFAWERTKVEVPFEFR